MSAISQNSSQWIDGSPDAILVSGGGDDVVGDQFIIYLDYFGGGLSNRIQGVVNSVEASYQALFDFRNLYAPDTPIFGHCYDYAIPNGMGFSSRVHGSSRRSISHIMITRTDLRNR